MFSQLATVFRLDLNTLQTAVSFYDRILSMVQISSKQLQICGLAALYFATKVLETAPFRAEEVEKYFAQVAAPKGMSVVSWVRVRLRSAEYLRRVHVVFDASAFLQKLCAQS